MGAAGSAAAAAASSSSSLGSGTAAARLTSSATLECAAASMPLPAAADCDPDAAAPPCTPTDGEVKLYTGGCMPLPELPTTTRLAASLAFCTLGSVAAEGSENVYVGAAAASWAADAVATCVAVRSAALPASSATDALADWAAGCPKAGAPAAGRVMGLSGRVHAFSAGAGVVLGGALLVGAAASAERPTAGDATGLMKSRAIRGPGVCPACGVGAPMGVTAGETFCRPSPPAGVAAGVPP